MKALLLFHFRVGARVAMRSFIPLFLGLLVAIMVQIDPIATFTSIALRVFATQPTATEGALTILSALVLPLWAVPQLALGLDGWMRHLPISRKGNRRGLLLASLTVQIPLVFSLILMAFVAHTHRLAVTVPMLRWGVLLAAGACAAVPVRRQWLTAPLSMAAAFLAVAPGRWPVIPAILLLFACDAFAGPVRRVRRRHPRRGAGALLDFRISWRALGWRAFTCYLMALIPVAAAGLFISNNELTGAFAGAAGRFGTGLAALVVIAAMSRRLALRRPPWPLARSFPWSAAHRVGSDALFLGLHALPLLSVGCLVNPAASIETLALLPFLSLRGAQCMRQMPARRTGAGSFVAEGIFVSGLSALLIWAALFWLAAAIPAFFAARNAEARQKVTRWLELHYANVGDSLSWSDG